MELEIKEIVIYNRITIQDINMPAQSQFSAYSGGGGAYNEQDVHLLNVNMMNKNAALEEEVERLR